MATIVLKCTCKHDFQDQEYGKGMRLHNISEVKKEAYCTVCSPSGRRNKVGSTTTVAMGKPFGMVVDSTMRESRKGKKI